MARPRKDQVGDGARERLEQAFWELLAQKPLRSISVLELSQRAGVNHNTFYYHFESIGDLALHQVSDNLPTEWFEAAAMLAFGAELDVRRFSGSADLQLRFERFRLLLSAADAQLIEVGKQRALEVLMGALGIDPQALGAHERLKLRFFIGGITSLLASSEIETLEQYLDLMQDGLAQTLRDLLHQAVGLPEPSI